MSHWAVQRRCTPTRGVALVGEEATASAAASDLARLRWKALRSTARMRGESATPVCVSLEPTTRWCCAWRANRQSRGLNSTDSHRESQVDPEATGLRERASGLCESIGGTRKAGNDTKEVGDGGRWEMVGGSCESEELNRTTPLTLLPSASKRCSSVAGSAASSASASCGGMHETYGQMERSCNGT